MRKRSKKGWQKKTSLKQSCEKTSGNISSSWTISSSYNRNKQEVMGVSKGSNVKIGIGLAANWKEAAEDAWDRKNKKKIMASITMRSATSSSSSSSAAASRERTTNTVLTGGGCIVGRMLTLDDRPEARERHIINTNHTDYQGPHNWRQCLRHVRSLSPTAVEDGDPRIRTVDNTERFAS